MAGWSPRQVTRRCAWKLPCRPRRSSSEMPRRTHSVDGMGHPMGSHGGRFQRSVMVDHDLDDLGVSMGLPILGTPQVEAYNLSFNGENGWYTSGWNAVIRAKGLRMKLASPWWHGNHHLRSDDGYLGTSLKPVLVTLWPHGLSVLRGSSDWPRGFIMADCPGDSSSFRRLTKGIIPVSQCLVLVRRHRASGISSMPLGPMPLCLLLGEDAVGAKVRFSSTPATGVILETSGQDDMWMVSICQHSLRQDQWFPATFWYNCDNLPACERVNFWSSPTFPPARISCWSSEFSRAQDRVPHSIWLMFQSLFLAMPWGKSEHPYSIVIPWWNRLTINLGWFLIM